MKPGTLITVKANGLKLRIMRPLSGGRYLAVVLCNGFMTTVSASERR